MIKLNITSIFTKLFIVALIHSTCDGLERKATDYVIPLYNAKLRNPDEIKRAAHMLEEIFHLTRGKSADDVVDFLRLIRWRVSAGFSSLTSGTQIPQIRFAGLINDDFRGQSSAGLIKINGKSSVLVKIIDTLIPFSRFEIADSSRCDFNRWLTFANTFISLYGIPEDNALTIHETGMRFASRASNQPRSQLYLYMKQFASTNLSSCLYHAGSTVESPEEENLDQFFAINSGKSNLIDEELWRETFNKDFKEPHGSIGDPFKTENSFLKSLRGWLSSRTCPPKTREFLESSAGLATLAMGVAPEEIRKFEVLNFALAKRIEYLRLCNLLDLVESETVD